MRTAAEILGKTFCLQDGALFERIKHQNAVSYIPEMAASSLLYSEDGRALLKRIYGGYFAVARDTGLPMMTITPTWRADPIRISKLGKKFADANRRAVGFLQELREKYCGGGQILIAGEFGCPGDCYKPEEALTAQAAEEFHSFQIAQFVSEGVDVLLPETLPALSEAIGIVKAINHFQTDYVVSWVTKPSGDLLDGVSISEAVKTIDQTGTRKPLGYLLNCTHASVLEPAVENLSPEQRSRLLGIKANPSSRPPWELEDAETTQTVAPEVFASEVIQQIKKHHLCVAGGCCGTDERHIRALAEAWMRQ